MSWSVLKCHWPLFGSWPPITISRHTASHTDRVCQAVSWFSLLNCAKKRPNVYTLGSNELQLKEMLWLTPQDATWTRPLNRPNGLLPISMQLKQLSVHIVNPTILSISTPQSAFWWEKSLTLVKSPSSLKKQISSLDKIRGSRKLRHDLFSRRKDLNENLIGFDRVFYSARRSPEVFNLFYSLKWKLKKSNSFLAVNWFVSNIKTFAHTAIDFVACCLLSTAIFTGLSNGLVSSLLDSLSDSLMSSQMDILLGTLLAS